MKTYILLALLYFGTTFSQTETNVFDIARKGTLKEMQDLWNKDKKVVTLLNSDGYTALTLAIYRNNNQVAKFLIENGADINGNSKMGTPLMAAIVKGNTEAAKLLIENKADVNAADENGTTALIYASNFKNYDLVSLLVSAGAKTEHKDNRNNSAIDYAILTNDDKLLLLLKNMQNK